MVARAIDDEPLSLSLSLSLSFFLSLSPIFLTNELPADASFHPSDVRNHRTSLLDLSTYIQYDEFLSTVVVKGAPSRRTTKRGGKKLAKCPRIWVTSASIKGLAGCIESKKGAGKHYYSAVSAGVVAPASVLLEVVLASWRHSRLGMEELTLIVGSIAETLGWEGEGEEALVQYHRWAYLVHTTLSVGLPNENGRYIPPELVAAIEVSSAGREEGCGAKEDNGRADTYLERCVGDDNKRELNGWGETSMKAVLELLDGQPITIQDEILRLPSSSSSPPPPPSQQQQQIHAKEPPGIGNAIGEKDGKGKEEEDGNRNFDAVDHAPLQASPQSEIREVSERV